MSVRIRPRHPHNRNESSYVPSRNGSNSPRNSTRRGESGQEIKTQARKFSNIKPPQVDRLVADDQRLVMIGNEQVSYIVVEVFRHALEFGNPMNVEAEDLIRNRLDQCETGLFIRLFPCNEEWIPDAVAMPAQVQPFTELAVKREKNHRAGTVQNDRRSSEMPIGVSAVERSGYRIQETDCISLVATFFPGMRNPGIEGGLERC